MCKEGILIVDRGQGIYSLKNVGTVLSAGHLGGSLQSLVVNFGLGLNSAGEKDRKRNSTEAQPGRVL